MNILVAVAFAALGAVFASFIAVVAERVNTGQSFFKGRSRCNACRRQLTVIDLVPIVSWSVFGGRCRTCRARIPATYTLYELALALSFLFAYLTFGLTLELPIFLLFVVTLGFIVLYDLRHTIVPVPASILLVILGLVFLFMSNPNLHTALVVVGIAFVIALGFFLLYALSRGRAMGLGDTPVAFALSLLAGNQAFAGLVFSFWIGAVIGILILVLRRGGPTMGIEVPFVPFLAVGYLLAIFTQWNPFLF